MKLLATDIKNNVLASMIQILDENRDQLLEANKKDLELFNKNDQAMYDRLIIDQKKIDEMILAVTKVKSQDDPVSKEISKEVLQNGLKIINKTAPFGTIMIIYESRPDVTIEAAVLAFKANNKILLKGGKEALYSNKMLVQFWHRALEKHNLSADYIQLLTMNRQETQEFLKNPTQKLDLIVPRGGDKLIAFVKEHAKCAVLVSGRGNNFLFIDKNADWQKSIKVILNAKTDKISACNALDKILISSEVDNYSDKLKDLEAILKDNGVSILVDSEVKNILKNAPVISDDSIWKEEFLAMKCCIGSVNSLDDAIAKINENSGGHSATIMTQSHEKAQTFMEQVDCAAVYQNASTRFTDGGQMGVGAELAISTDKLHHRGPLGLNELVTNKYYVFGDGQIRE
ncbi:glutamate-5-semialdehyde dehydrogenase [Cellulophaga sp. HaHaR_3_176]|uniref:glutamate-5-semialdehyde dehydrogenase n=1 Tax=Cellulophaga sp. HaHaR_3_176 TaxID=1942464 RepID=UPI001C1FFC56|nr:glutamate-5-semialdehyde dehydrogenase [Cellulophaga sp. HaHaR_3_176]QWX83775.1 glutamate-5-semialdehyde dehydrogenase [Cellulophaga sp. HaHaR_3_176]